MLSDEWLPRYRLLENFTAKWNGNGNAYDRGDYNSSFALRAVELKIGGRGGGRVCRDAEGGGSGWGCQGGCERRIEVSGKIHKKKIRGEGGGEGGRVGGGGGGVVRVDVKVMLGVGGQVGVGLVGGQGGCERKIEVFVKIKKKKFGGGGGAKGGRVCRDAGGGGGGGGGRVGGVRVDVNDEELKFLGKFTKKKIGGGGGGGGRGGGQGGCESNVGGRGLCGVWEM